MPVLQKRDPAATQGTPVSCDSERAASKCGRRDLCRRRYQPSPSGPLPHAPAAAPAPVDLKDPALYVNRELSLLAFQRRVLEEAEDETNPLLERVKFLSILGSNLDEFFMVRVAGLAAQMEAGSIEAGPDGMSPRAQLVAIRREVKRLLAEAHRTLEHLLAASWPSRAFSFTTTPSSPKPTASRPPGISTKPCFPC
jgi:hypothetical protein